MNRSKILNTGLSILFASILLFSYAFRNEKVKDKPHRIVFQLTSADTSDHKALIKQINNLQEGFQPVQLEVVAHSPGISFLMKDKTKFTKEISELKAKGVTFAACENTLKERKIEKSEIVAEAVFVPMGIGEIVLKQEEGCSYIKAGN